MNGALPGHFLLAGIQTNAIVIRVVIPPRIQPNCEGFYGGVEGMCGKVVLVVREGEDDEDEDGMRSGMGREVIY